MGSEITVRLEINEALLLHHLLTAMSLDMKEKKDKEGKGSDLPADLLKITLKIQHGVLESFVGGQDGTV